MNTTVLPRKWGAGGSQEDMPVSLAPVTGDEAQIVSKRVSRSKHSLSSSVGPVASTEVKEDREAEHISSPDWHARLWLPN